MSTAQGFQGLSITGCQWRAAEIDEAAATALSTQLDLPPLVARALVWRGMRELADAERFLNTSLSSIPDPGDMLNMSAACAVIVEALKKGDPIRIVGDYDCDGTTGLITLLQTFRLINPQAAKKISYHVPDREREGYGLNPDIIERAAVEGVKVLISVDIGITAHREWELAHARGIKGICIDHHTILGSSAPANAIVLCPKQAGCPYPEKDLAACGISLQLARALLADHPRRDTILQSLCKLVAIGTVSDMVPLRSLSNRAIVQEGLRGLNTGSTNKGLDALLEIAGLSEHQITTYDLGFKLGPRINAAGRMDGSTLQVIELLDATTRENARVLAAQIDELNRQRQAAQQWLVDELLEVIEQQSSNDRVFVFGGEHEKGWHQGVVGIAAAKIVERYGRPALVCAIRNGMAHGSARSIKKFNIVQALEAVADGLLVKYGGHAMAAGFVLPADRIGELQTRLNDYARTTLVNQDLIPIRSYEAELTTADISLELIKTLAGLEPHGVDNPRPTFIIKGRLIEARPVGNKHLRLRLIGPGPALDAIWWYRGELYEKLRLGGNVVLLGKLEINEWNGIKKPQLNVDDLYRIN
ncbi:MAG: single-stranded-DNA-specific exonuclease RecJ [Acidobacteriota bacterium]